MDAPVAFVSHGAPSLALDAADPTHRFLKDFGAALAGGAAPRGIVCISAHWETATPAVTAGDAPATIHDFYGFPAPLYALRYPAPGSPALAARVRELLSAAGHDAHLDLRRGLDHGAWVPLMLMHPAADIPVVQLSVQTARDGAHHLALGRALAPLRAEGILILGSGGATHPLAEAFRGDWRDSPGETEPWSAAFDDWLDRAVTTGDAAALADWDRAPHARRVHPTPEHFLPLLVAAGAGGVLDGRKGARAHRGWAYHLLSMAAYRWD